MKIVMKVWPNDLRDFLDGSLKVLRNIAADSKHLVEIQVDSTEYRIGADEDRLYIAHK